LAKKRNMELQAEHDVLLATNKKLSKQADGIFGATLESAEKRIHELEAEILRVKFECGELEEQIR